MIPDYSDVDKPDWVCESEARDPHSGFWQVKFSEEETKTKIPVHIILPRCLVQQLEEYLSVFRPVLLAGRHSETLLVCPEADKVNSNFVTDTVSDVTLRYGGRRVTPHLFRDIVAFAWLKEHPKDYLTLSKILWHTNVRTTIEKYGSRFNESSGVVAMEAWREERQTGAKK